MIMLQIFLLSVLFASSIFGMQTTISMTPNGAAAVAWIADKPFITIEEFKPKLVDRLEGVKKIYNNFSDKQVPDYAVSEAILKTFGEFIMKKIPPLYLKDHPEVKLEDYKYVIGIKNETPCAELTQKDFELLESIAMSMDVFSKKLSQDKEVIAWIKNNKSSLENEYNRLAQKLAAKQVVMPSLDQVKWLLAINLMAKDDKSKNAVIEETQTSIPAALAELYNIQIDLTVVNQILQK